ncbi:MAG: YebC/PmpR family DNA-binding transcriptional regulator [bacterium]|nr:YebC/PmpR family DNA-binding transcriptional regulator [bacterium]
MSGHNKWSQIKIKKGKTDAKKSQVFSKFAKLIANEARTAKGNKDAPMLRAAIERARKENMPSDNIERAIKKATEDSSASLESVLYEAYGPGGVAILIEALTDSRNRASNEIKHLLSENGGNLASPGAAAWAFEKTPEGWKPTTTVSLSDEDLAKLEALVEKLEAHDDIQEVITNAE